MPMDWILGLIGGLMIGSAAAIYLLVSGRIMGASGILGGLVDLSSPSLEKAVFVAGLVAAPLAYGMIWGFPQTNLTADTSLLIIAGLFVGIGTRMANGCTSGHGVCGISRFSVRGITATVTFLFFGALAMYVLRHVLGVI
ncbi:YeeE/YedE family protein [Shimia ponticola]|uniref:YeeE/YedE family protein n=1 Tax=Shimia ponticola TaxID=2582893 RepID=UPI0011BFB7A3|nr:YeeE/YedE family protein [Shimia ponticola]